MKRLSLIFLLFLLFFFNPQKTFAATFTFGGAPISVQDNQSFTVNFTVKFVDSPPGTVYYLRGAFFASSSSPSYFGYTKNNIGNLYKVPSIGKTDFTQFYKITLDQNKQWSETLEVKPDPQSSAYKGPGSYSFKLGRYTTSGYLTWCSDESIPCNIARISIISSSTPTPTATPTPTPAASSTPTPVESSTPGSSSVEDSTPEPTGDASSTSETLMPKATSVSISLAKEISSKSSKNILGTESSSLKFTNKPQAVKTLAAKEENFPKILIALGIVIITLSLGIYVKSLIKR